MYLSVLSNLYYPSPYRFDVIPLKTLSDIYDLFLGYELVVEGTNVSDVLRSEFKKSNGAVTTPSEIVNQVISSTIPDSALSTLTTAELLDLRIADIACGSGAFLIGVFDYLIKEIEKRISRGESIGQNYVVQVGDRSIITLEGRRAIIKHC